MVSLSVKCLLVSKSHHSGGRGRPNNVLLCWVSGHADISGKECGDMLVNKVSAVTFIGLQPFYVIYKMLTIQAISTWAQKEHKMLRDISELRMSKLPLLVPPKQVTSDLLSLGRCTIRKVVELIMAQILEEIHAQDWHICWEPLCRKCVVIEKTVRNLIFE